LEKRQNTKVYVGLSGGVDSAVSAALLQKDGYDVTGVFIRIALPGYPCSAGEDKIEAMRVAAHLKIPFRAIDLSEEYAKEVFANTLSEFKKGHTPNPDALCNEKIKFGAFFKYAMNEGADFVATGHYARVAHDERGSTLLKMGADAEKDQSYFLWMVPKSALKKTLFPIGHLEKPEVRALARKFGLPNAGRPDSQGLCFLGDISIEDMLTRELAPISGDVLDESGTVIGAHDGALLYTPGQRHGFRLFPSKEKGAGENRLPYFVIGKDVGANTITVSPSRHPDGMTKTIVKLADTNWIRAPRPGKKYSARFRYRQALVPTTLESDLKTTTLDAPFYVPLGQALVLYEGEECLGGGILHSFIVDK